MPYNYTIIDMRTDEPEVIRDHLMTLMKSVGSSSYKGDYYCGIATEPENRFEDHERRHWKIKRIIGVIDCGTSKRCCDVEELMADEGFDVGDAPRRGAGDDTRYVYLVEKGKLVNEGMTPLSDFLKKALGENT